MNGLKKSPQVVITTFCFLLLSGCAGTVMLPEGGRLVEAHEAFPDRASMVPPADKRGAYQRAVLHAPYAVVYRVALVSVSETGMQLVSNDKQQGIILATIAEASRNTGSSVHKDGGLRESVLFFAVRIKEVGSNRTEVTISTKVHGRCTYSNPSGFLNAAAMGLTTPVMLAEKRECETFSTLRWADGVDSKRALLGSYLSSVRTKVIKAGYE